jgi:hypothetical protein
MRCKLGLNIASFWKHYGRISCSRSGQERLKTFSWNRAGGAALFGMALASSSSMERGPYFPYDNSYMSVMVTSHCLASDSSSQGKKVGVMHSTVDDDEAVAKYVDQILGVGSNVNIPGFPGKYSNTQLALNWHLQVSLIDNMMRQMPSNDVSTAKSSMSASTPSATASARASR